MYLVFVQYWALEFLIPSIKHVVFFCQGTNVDMGESSLWGYFTGGQRLASAYTVGMQGEGRVIGGALVSECYRGIALTFMHKGSEHMKLVKHWHNNVVTHASIYMSFPVAQILCFNLNVRNAIIINHIHTCSLVVRGTNDSPVISTLIDSPCRMHILFVPLVSKQYNYCLATQ